MDGRGGRGLAGAAMLRGFGKTSGPFAARPPATFFNKGQRYFATDISSWFENTAGTSWIPLTPSSVMKPDGSLGARAPFSRSLLFKEGFRPLPPTLMLITSVGLTVPSWLTVSGSPITAGVGTLAVTSASGQTANQFLATPNGGTGIITLRAIVPADIPSLYNYLINGGFDFAQRQDPTAFTTVGTSDSYTADRWKAAWQTASLQYKRLDTNGSLETGITARYYGQYKQITAKGKFVVYQILEGVNSYPLNSSTVIFQARMKASSAKTIRMGILYLNSSGTMDTIPNSIQTAWNTDTNDPTWGTNINTVITGSKSVTTSWTNFSVTAAAPSNAKNFICAIWTDGQFSANDTLSITEAGMYVAGAVVTPYQPRLIQQELALCQRYYCKTFNIDQNPVQNIGISGGSPGAILAYTYATATTFQFMWFFPGGRMRAVPAIVTYNPGAVNNKWRNAANNADATSATFSTGEYSVSIYSSDATGVAGTFYLIHASADVDL
jgi:hypothetical protein